MFRPIWSSSSVNIFVLWKLLSFRFRTYIDGPIYTLVHLTVMVRSSCCVVLYVFVCGLIYALVYPIVMVHSSCCVLCACMWSRLCASASHSNGSFFLLCCVVLYVFVCDPIYALVYPIMMVRSSFCFLCVIMLCGINLAHRRDRIQTHTAQQKKLPIALGYTSADTGPHTQHKRKNGASIWDTLAHRTDHIQTHSTQHEERRITMEYTSAETRPQAV
jgi:hypothetical protein